MQAFSQQRLKLRQICRILAHTLHICQKTGTQEKTTDLGQTPTCICKNQTYFLWVFFYFIFLIFKIFIGVQLLYNVVLVSTVQQSESAIRIHICPLFWISFSCRSLQSTEQSSLCYAVGSHQLSILYIVSIVYICQSQSPNSSHIPLSPLVSIHLFSTSVALFLLCK